MAQLLVGDVGGTNTRLATAETIPIDHHGIRAVHTYENDRFGCLEDVIAADLESRSGETYIGACLALAAPVHGATVPLTNRDWTIEAHRIEAVFATVNPSEATPPVILVNDFEALARGLPFLSAADMIALDDLTPEVAGARIVIGPGTGLGVAGLVVDREGIAAGSAANASFVAVPGEGGHMEVPVRTEDELRLLLSVGRKLGLARVSAERVLSGPGLTHVYGAFARLAGSDQPQLTAAGITSRALAGTDPIAMEAVRQFCVWALRLAGDLALLFWATGGVYLAGGMSAHLTPWLQDPEIRAAFADKGRYSDALERIPVRILNGPVPALTGAATVARQRLGLRAMAETG